MKKVLVANRGEIARRIFRTCRSLGLSTVAVYSDADANAVHVEEANEAHRLGAAPARDSYLNVDQVLVAAHASAVDAIHPGYGFLAESADFAQRAMNEGFTWIGPTPEAIRQMGDKQESRRLAIDAHVPVVPGSGSFPSNDLTGLEAAAERIGYPLLVKATVGGGGIGMRRIDKPEQLTRTVVATQSMAQKAFGDGSIFLECFIPTARHVEIQVFGFGDGSAIHLHERDCSLQRRYQKVIEESPAPGLPADVRSAMIEAALSLCRVTQYSGAGTVEFIVDAQTFDFHFLEMNTRIQVEHPVTEMVTGTDLVAMQIDLARHALQRPRQSQIIPKGHAIEARVYAENPAKHFMPSPGRLETFRPPHENPRLRIDSGYREGDQVTPYYDPMIAKVIVHGEDRNDARDRLAEALRSFIIDGIGTNRKFLIACLEDVSFAQGDVSTNFIEARRERLLAA